jgi:hypothetical protein
VWSFAKPSQTTGSLRRDYRRPVPHLIRLKSPTAALPVGYEAFDRDHLDSRPKPNQLDRFRRKAAVADRSPRTAQVADKRALPSEPYRYGLRPEQTLDIRPHLRFGRP